MCLTSLMYDSKRIVFNLLVRKRHSRRFRIYIIEKANKAKMFEHWSVPARCVRCFLQRRSCNLFAVHLQLISLSSLMTLKTSIWSIERRTSTAIGIKNGHARFMPLSLHRFTCLTHHNLPTLGGRHTNGDVIMAPSAETATFANFSCV